MRTQQGTSTTRAGTKTSEVTDGIATRGTAHHRATHPATDGYITKTVIA